MIDANRIRQVVAARYTAKRWAVHFEVGLVKGGRLRADVVAINMGGGIEIIEVKSSVADFRSDKKMQNYLKYADKMYLACSKEVYDKIKTKVLPGIGVYVVGENSVYVAKRARRHETHSKTRWGIMTRMAYRSADQTLHARKSKTAGRQYVASAVVQAIQALPKPRTEKQVQAAIEEALVGIV
jgi:hypothetical protein